VIDVRKRTLSSKYDVFTHNGTRKAGVTAIEFAQAMEAAGAGEIVLNAIERDGVMQGYDIELARQLRSAVNVPISILGGAGSLNDIEGLISEVGVLGAVAGSLFVFKGKYRAVLINYPQPAAKEELVRRAMKH
jgi:imidazole glycerol-phosphate synthase subunit HisF